MVLWEMMQERYEFNCQGLVCELEKLELNSIRKEDPSRDFGQGRNMITSVTVIIIITMMTCIPFCSFIIGPPLL